MGKIVDAARERMQFRTSVVTPAEFSGFMDSLAELEDVMEARAARLEELRGELADSQRTADNLTKGKQASGKRIAQLEEKVARLAMYISLYYMPTYSVPNKEK